MLLQCFFFLCLPTHIHNATAPRCLPIYFTGKCDVERRHHVGHISCEVYGSAKVLPLYLRRRASRPTPIGELIIRRHGAVHQVCT